MDETFVQGSNKLNSPKDMSLYYKNIGLLTCEFEDKSHGYGTGCLISSNIVLTCAHNIVSYKEKLVKAKRIYFDRATHGQQKKENMHKVRSYSVARDYLTNITNKIERSKYDYALLKIQNNSNQEVKKQSWSFMPFQTAKNLALEKQIRRNTFSIQIYGYPYKYQDQDNKSFLMKGSGTQNFWIDKQEEYIFLNYKLTTYQGQSGSPIVKYCHDGIFAIIGIHTRTTQKEKNFNNGLIFRQSMLAEIKEWYEEYTSNNKKLVIWSFSKDRFQIQFQSNEKKYQKIYQGEDLSQNESEISQIQNNLTQIQSSKAQKYIIENESFEKHHEIQEQKSSQFELLLFKKKDHLPPLSRNLKYLEKKISQIIKQAHQNHKMDKEILFYTEIDVLRRQSQTNIYYQKRNIWYKVQKYKYQNQVLIEILNLQNFFYLPNGKILIQFDDKEMKSKTSQNQKIKKKLKEKILMYALKHELFKSISTRNEFHKKDCLASMICPKIRDTYFSRYITL